jgi:hypothetical protein
MSPRRGSKPRRTDRLVVGRNVTLTLTLTWLMASESQLGLQKVLGPVETQQEL